MRIAIQGCGHGNLNAIYARLKQMETETGHKADMLIVCGDFQAMRNQADLDTMACPLKYREMGDFHEYYYGKKTAPLLTIFIGGNHEASAHMWELYHGGWVAPGIYFVGYAGVVKIGGLRIAGISGIYSKRHYNLGFYERVPYDADAIHSVYHTRKFDVLKLSLLDASRPLDILISHEWPHQIYRHGDCAGLIRRKMHFKNDIEHGGIGAPPLKELLESLQPQRWFAAHMHVEFEAEVKHVGGKTTKFLSLDKCLPKRRHMRIIEFGLSNAEASDNFELEYDEEWLAIVRATNSFMNLSKTSTCIPDRTQLNLHEHREFISALKSSLCGKLLIPKNYMRPSMSPGHHTTLLQTAQFCKLLQIKDYWNQPSSGISQRVQNEDEISID